MKKFEIGKTYSTRSICNQNCIWSFTVIKRTPQTITAIDSDDNEKTYRICKKISEYRKAESFKPFGDYSMAPTISAE